MCQNDAHDPARGTTGHAGRWKRAVHRLATCRQPCARTIPVRSMGSGRSAADGGDAWTKVPRGALHVSRRAGDSEPLAMPRTQGLPLVTTEFHPLASFASFRDAEAEMLRDWTFRMPLFTAKVAAAVVDQLSHRLISAGVAGGVSEEAVAAWLARSSTGPFDADFARFLRSLTHVGGGVTFPGFRVPMAPQMIVAAMAWVQGQILLALGNVTDTI